MSVWYHLGKIILFVEISFITLTVVMFKCSPSLCRKLNCTTVQHKKLLRNYFHVCFVYRVIVVNHVAQTPTKRQESTYISLNQGRCGLRARFFSRNVNLPSRSLLHHRMVAREHYCCSVCVEKVERTRLTILRPDVCSDIGVVYTVVQTITHLWGGL